jgi:hypothetical protein
MWLWHCVGSPAGDGDRTVAIRLTARPKQSEGEATNGFASNGREL